MKSSIHFSATVVKKGQPLQISGVGYLRDGEYSYDIDELHLRNVSVPLEVLTAFDIELSDDDQIHDACLVSVREAFQASKQRTVFEVMAAMFNPHAA